MSDIFEQLISGSRQDAPQPELLEALGKKAAAQYLQNGSVLNESIVKLASEYPNLGNEHLKRIAEFANNAVFQQLHSQSEDKNVHFDIADPGVIIQDLRDGGSPAHDGKTLNTGLPQNKRSYVPSPTTDYNAPPNVPNSSGFSDTTSGMSELDRQNEVSGLMGAGEPISKTASSHRGLVHSNPLEDVFNTHIRVRATRDKLAEAHEHFDIALRTAKEDFYQGVKQIVLDPDGPGLMGVVNAVKLASPNDSFAFRVLKPVTERLVKEGAIRPSTNLEKTAAQKIVNFKHPVMVAYAGIMKMAEEKVRSLAALQEAEKALEKTAAFLKENVQ
jgi:hypothetical protein